MTRGKGETHDLCRHPLVKELTWGNSLTRGKDLRFLPRSDM